MSPTSYFRALRPTWRVCSGLSGIKRNSIRTLANAASPPEKREGDISAAFASLSGLDFKPLDSRFATMKQNLIAGRENALQDSWTRLLLSLQEDISLITDQGSSIIPEIDFADLDKPNPHFRAEHKKRGVAIIRNVLPVDEALQLKTDLRAYIAANPQTRAFPAENPQVFELYWSPSQIRARSHPNLLKTQRFLMEFWHSRDPRAPISSSHPIVYADRLRMRLPGDNQFALGAHVDGGSCERWEQDGYGRGGVYDAIWEGRWEDFDPWESSCRLPVVPDLYQGVGACSMFRMMQGWLSMSSTGPFEGTLLVNPLFNKATAYYLLRPFFSPITPPSNPPQHSPTFLSPSNWRLSNPQTSWLHGASPGSGQELRDHLHPHLSLPQTMLHIPQVEPGDYVSWHCDTIHAVDSVHAGKTDSSVLYIPACPLTPGNAAFLARQRAAFLAGRPCPDFGGGVGEAQHLGRPGVEDVRSAARGEEDAALRAWGLKAWEEGEEGLTEGQRALMEIANQVLGL